MSHTPARGERGQVSCAFLARLAKLDFINTLLILDMIEPSYVKVVVRVDGSSIFVLVPAMRDAVHVDM